MKITFRKYHLLKILESFDLEPLPLDVHLGRYFRTHRAIGSKDRRYIADKIYKIIRWMALIDHHSKGTCTWEQRYTMSDILDLQKSDVSIPPHIRVSFPKNLFNFLHNQFGGEQALAICYASNTQAPTTVRINPLKTTRNTLLATWKEQFFVTPTPKSTWGIHFKSRLNFATLQEFQQGCFEVQDEASQLIANLIDAKPGDRVLDYCAGSGGKTLAFAHKLQGKGELYLHDIRLKALIQAKKRIKRAGIENAQILDSKHVTMGKLKGKMDWVLVDVPCTGSGTLRRNPDLKWKFSEKKLDNLVLEQREIFQQALKYLAPHGRIVYSTCSILKQENLEQIEHFQKTHHLHLTEDIFYSLPMKGSMDGFFGAVLAY